MHTRFSVRVIIGLVAIGVVGIPVYAKTESKMEKLERGAPLIAFDFFLENAKASEVADAIRVTFRELFPQQLRIRADERKNLLTITAPAEVGDRLKDLIKELDVY